jgi:general secretion pathway protein B
MADLPAVEAEPFTEALEPPAPPEAETAPPPGGASTSHIQREAMPSAEQLIATGALSGAPMHLDIHVYSSNPAERFVFINMRKYTEGTELPEGPRLEEITPEGAIFTINGQRFALARD